MLPIPLLIASSLLTFVTAQRVPSPITAKQRGFNYNVTTDEDFRTRFTTAKNLVGTTGFTSAPLYTMIAPDTANDIIAAFQPAIDTGTTLLLGFYCSAGQTAFDSGKIALEKALETYKSQFPDLVVGISVGSEDLYRTSVWPRK